MSITLLDIEFLVSSTGELLLQRLRGENLSETNTLRLLTTLRKDYSTEQAGAALEMARLRLKAVDKFGDDATKMFFTRQALEQASDPLVRAYRAEVIPTPRPPPHSNREGEQKQKLLPTTNIFVSKALSDEADDASTWENDIRAVTIVDAGCGIGADSLAFAKAGADVTGLDIDPVRIAIARYNAQVLGLKAHFEAADIRDGLPPAAVVFFDPARRDDQGKRIYDVERYQPPLSIVRDWRHASVCVKLSPGVDLSQLAGYGGRLEFISVMGDLKEAVLWLGEGQVGIRATLLIGDAVYGWENATPPPGPLPVYGEGEKYSTLISLSAPRVWLVEPDPAILRAGLVQDVAAQFDGFMLDETIAYFTTDAKPESPWVRAWQILDWMPFNLKKLRAYLRERNVGNVTVKKRGSPVTPEALIPQLKLKGGESRTLALTRFQGQPIVIICTPHPG